MLPLINGEFGVVADPEARFSQKGNMWVKVRVVAKDRRRDSNGVWSDGDPCFLDVVAFGTIAENLAESVLKGDTITVTGRLAMSEWTTDDGQKRQSYQIQADSLGVSLRWNPATTKRPEREQAGRGQTSEQPTEAPF